MPSAGKAGDNETDMTLFLYETIMQAHILFE